jgi:hypothetical protein
MNDDNKKFIEDFQKRVNNYPEYDGIVSDVDEKRREIVSSIGDSIKFLNEGVLSTGTSSLQRTEVRLPKDNANATWDTSEEIITFNHKGICSLRLKEEGKYSYGTVYSRELNNGQFLKVITDDTLRTGVTTDLINNKSMKLLKRFNDVCSVGEEVRQLKALADKYDGTHIAYVFQEPQEVFKAEIDTTDEGTHFINLNKLIVEKISLVGKDTFSVHVKLSEEDLAEAERGRASYEKNDANEINFRTADITTSMFLMQFPDEVKKALATIKAESDADHAKAMSLRDALDTKLAEYAVLKSLREGN